MVRSTNTSYEESLFLTMAQRVHETRDAGVAYDLPWGAFDKWRGVAPGYFQNYIPLDREKDVDSVVLSLCFMAAMVEAGDA